MSMDEEMAELIVKVLSEARKDFDEVFTSCIFKYTMKYQEKGDSWKRMTFHELLECFQSEEQEFYEAISFSNPIPIMIQEEIKDMILYLMMMYGRVGA